MALDIDQLSIRLSNDGVIVTQFVCVHLTVNFHEPLFGQGPQRDFVNFRERRCIQY
ncbi:hypothetical protein C7S17_5093 [Burkholderia thailandensis]|nr:hypothetical protein [Burkholderia thailandensis]